MVMKGDRISRIILVLEIILIILLHINKKNQSSEQSNQQKAGASIVVPAPKMVTSNIINQ